MPPRRLESSVCPKSLLFWYHQAPVYLKIACQRIVADYTSVRIRVRIRTFYTSSDSLIIHFGSNSILIFAIRTAYVKEASVLKGLF